MNRKKHTSRITVGQLRQLIREQFKQLSQDCWGGSRPEETYDQLLVNDPEHDKRSVYVPDDIKAAIKKWSSSMGLGDSKRSA